MNIHLLLMYFSADANLCDEMFALDLSVLSKAPSESCNRILDYVQTSAGTICQSLARFDNVLNNSPEISAVVNGVQETAQDVLTVAVTLVPFDESHQSRSLKGATEC